ncbi:LOG family protein [Paenibacillus planticolens]|uniref:Cytokinin riboside 5'-monophosphate phosphoribohydrolase n=1 Tax=Paenibacillus planticolens TaxID=2654976 RepID=A0ABX1ZH65_9BACL|nr:TIGR00730 family Rossman fold protein [Paenibacillus planticolens]NOU98762.1 TIGR00730 family Rossman fold protein [Paenibacillus planticolens]
MKTIAVFCGSGTGNDAVYMEEARNLGKAIAAQGWALVYGGATVGCMGAVADAVMEAGGKVIGVIPKKLSDIEIAHPRLSELHVVDTMHERKAMMAAHADAFVTLPGGVGTLEEYFEVLTWAHIGYHNKPCALLNVNEYYTPMISLIDHMMEQGFVKESTRKLMIVENEPICLLERLKEGWIKANY